MPTNALPAQTINAAPPSVSWPSGHADVVLINTDPAAIWPQSGLSGKNTTEHV